MSALSEIFKRISHADCDFSYLEHLADNIDKTACEDGDVFDKYYSLDLVKNAMARYAKKLCTAQYLAYWANAYNGILSNAMLKSPVDFGESNFLDVLRYQITGVLERLSLFDLDLEIANTSLKGYIKPLEFYDMLYRSAQDWQVFFTPVETNSGFIETEFIVVSKTQKQFASFRTDIEFVPSSGAEVKLDAERLSELVETLLENGFKQI